MSLDLKIYKNSTEIATLNGVPLYMSDIVDASLRGKLNIFLQGDTGSGKTQIVRDVMSYFGDKSLFILGRNDMDTRELFQRVNPKFLKALRDGSASDVKFKELTDRINYHLIAVDELPNCVPAVRAQLFNLFDGFIEIDGVAYPIGSGYCVGMATGNIGQQFTESANELGRAMKDRMHLILDTDYFKPQPIDTLQILDKDRNPRVKFEGSLEDKTKAFMEVHKKLSEQEVPFEKLVVANYLIHGLDYLEGNKSKIRMKSGWPNKLEGKEVGGDAALILPVSPRAAKAILTLSQALDQITHEKGAKVKKEESKTVTENPNFNSMMTAFKLVGAYSGILNEALVRGEYDEDHYKAMDAVIGVTIAEFDRMRDHTAAGMEMVRRGENNQKLMDEFSGRWGFMKNIFENLHE